MMLQAFSFAKPQKVWTRSEQYIRYALKRQRDAIISD